MLTTLKCSTIINYLSSIALTAIPCLNCTKIKDLTGHDKNRDLIFSHFLPHSQSHKLISTTILHRKLNVCHRSLCKNKKYMYYTEILEVNLFAFAYRLFHEDLSPLDIY